MLNVKNLSIIFHDREEPFHAVKGISFQVEKGEIVGIVGESGSGKSMTAHTIMGLVKRGDVTISGTAEFDGADLLSMSREELRGYQGEELSIIFQEPMTSLNPTMKIGKQVEESLRIHTRLSKEERRAVRWRPWSWPNWTMPSGCMTAIPTSFRAVCGSVS